MQILEAIANDVADLVCRVLAALSGEHGDGLVRSPFMRKMFGPVLYEAFRTVKRTFDPHGILNPGKIVDCQALTENLRLGAGYAFLPILQPSSIFSEFGGMGGAVENVQRLLARAARNLKAIWRALPTWRYLCEEKRDAHARGRANVLRLAMTGRLKEAGLDEQGVHDTLDLCLECRACKAECPVGVDMARFKSEFLAGYWQTYGTPLEAKLLGNIRTVAKLGSPIASLTNRITNSTPVRHLNEALLGIDRRRTLPQLSRRTLESRLHNKNASDPDVLLFNDTFTNYYDPEIGIAAWEVLESGGLKLALAPNHCCGRPMISKGLLREAN